MLVTRKQPGATGNVHFSMKALMKNAGGVADEVKKVYDKPALVPASPWLGDQKPGPPKLTKGPAGLMGVGVEPAAGEPVRCYVVRPLTGGRWQTHVIGTWKEKGGGSPFVHLPAGTTEVVVSAVSRTGAEGEPARAPVR